MARRLLLVERARRASSGAHPPARPPARAVGAPPRDRKSTRLNSSHGYISYAVFCLKKKIVEHVVEGPLLAILIASKSVFGEGVAEDDVIGILAFDEHVGLANVPDLIVPVLTEEHRS